MCPTLTHRPGVPWAQCFRTQHSSGEGTSHEAFPLEGAEMRDDLLDGSERLVPDSEHLAGYRTFQQMLQGPEASRAGVWTIPPRNMVPPLPIMVRPAPAYPSRARAPMRPRTHGRRKQSAQV